MIKEKNVVINSCKKFVEINNVFFNIFFQASFCFSGEFFSYIRSFGCPFDRVNSSSL